MLPFAVDAASGAPCRLDPADLTRHAVCVGMTGSGKTGLCVALLEAVASAGVPLLCLDPKGDLTNLALQFPGFPAPALEPWIDPVDAERSGRSRTALAHETASTWRAAHEAAGLSTTDHALFAASVDVEILTPGASFGVPIDVVSALTEPPSGMRNLGTLRAYVSGVVTALLDLVGIRADPMTDPRAILLSRVLLDAFAAGETVPFDALLACLVDPPFPQLGAFGVDQVLARPERVALALQLNTLLAAPTFAAWRHGVPLDVDRLLAPRSDGRTPIRVLTLAHLDDRERMFFVSLFLHRLVAWTRAQEGTSRLRSLLFFDEVFGYLPPHPHVPPSKAPLLSLLKQARSVGMGVALATQNPVDLDYKALSNAGTWFLGRLQTAQDRARVQDGLTQAGIDAAPLDDLVGDLPARTFVWRDVRGTTKVIRSRQTLSLLRGPLGRDALRRLLGDRAERWGAPKAEGTSAPPPVPDGVHVRWLASTEGDLRARLDHPRGTLRRPAVLTRLQVTFDEGGWFDAQTIDLWVSPSDAVTAADALAASQLARRLVFDPGWVVREPADGDRYGPLPRWLETESEHRAWVRRAREIVHAEVVAEGPNGPVRAEYGDVRVVWVGVVWG